MSALTDLFTAFANKIRSKTGGSDTYTPPQMINAIDDVYQAGVDAGTTPTQTKTVTAGTTATTVTPDTGYALSSVTVNPTPSQSKSATPTTSAQTISPDSGKLLSSVSVGAIQTETKSDTPNVSTNKTVSPSSGKYLSQVTIQPLTHSGTYTPAANTAQNDMGAYHDKRYVNTSGMIVPSGAKSITANGTGIDVSSYATANVSVPNPTLSGNATAADVKSGKTFYGSNYTKQTGTYVEPTINSITPSNSSPVSMSANNNYKPSTAGYAIEDYSTWTTAQDGTYYPSGIVAMAASGYIYANKAYKYGWDSETTLWTNSNATSAFVAQTITVSDMSSYEYIKLYYKIHRSEGTVKGEAIFPLNVFKTMTEQNVSYIPTMAFGGRNSSGSTYVRRIFYVSNTQIKFSTAQQTGVSGSDTSWAIPTKITGLK